MAAIEHIVNALEVWLPIRILRTKTTPSHEERLKDLLKRADCPIDGPIPAEDVDQEALDELLSDDAIENEPEFAGLLPNSGETDDQVEEEVLVVEITANCAEDEEVLAEIRRCATSGGVVIGVWPPEGEPRGKVPEALDRLGAGLVEWSADRLRNAVVRGDLPWANADGSPRAKKNIARNRC